MKAKWTIKDIVQMIKYRSYIKAPRWAGIQEYLLTAPLHFNLESKIIAETKRLLTTTIVYELEGEQDDITRFKKQMFHDVEKYNN